MLPHTNDAFRLPQQLHLCSTGCPRLGPTSTVKHTARETGKRNGQPSHIATTIPRTPRPCRPLIERLAPPVDSTATPRHTMAWQPRWRVALGSFASQASTNLFKDSASLADTAVAAEKDS